MYRPQTETIALNCPKQTNTIPMLNNIEDDIIELTADNNNLQSPQGYDSELTHDASDNGSVAGSLNSCLHMAQEG